MTKVLAMYVYVMRDVGHCFLADNMEPIDKQTVDRQRTRAESWYFLSHRVFVLAYEIPPSRYENEQAEQVDGMRLLEYVLTKSMDDKIPGYENKITEPGMA
jgi:hypothetical protein